MRCREVRHSPNLGMEPPCAKRRMFSDSNYQFSESDTHTSLDQSATQWLPGRAVNQYDIAACHIIVVMLPKDRSMGSAIMWPPWVTVIGYVEERPARHDLDIWPIISQGSP